MVREQRTLKKWWCVFCKQLLALLGTAILNVFWGQKRAENFEN